MVVAGGEASVEASAGLDKLADGSHLYFIPPLAKSVDWPRTQLMSFDLLILISGLDWMLTMASRIAETAHLLSVISTL